MRQRRFCLRSKCRLRDVHIADRPDGSGQGSLRAGRDIGDRGGSSPLPQRQLEPEPGKGTGGVEIEIAR